MNRFMVLNNGYNDSLIGRSFNISATTENADERILVIEVILCGTACRRYSEFCVGTSADAAMSSLLINFSFKIY